jgi:hypothetical protein
MLKRIRWMGTGVLIGFGGSVWLQKRMKAVADRYKPGGLAARARDAVVEGRQAMKEREAQLRRTAQQDSSRRL